MTIYVDIDGTICKTKGNDYKNSVPIPENIEKINKLFDEGNEIYYWTSRGGTSGVNWFEITLNQLQEWGCRFYGLNTNKPSYDILYDDKAKKL